MNQYIFKLIIEETTFLKKNLRIVINNLISIPKSDLFL